MTIHITLLVSNITVTTSSQAVADGAVQRDVGGATDAQSGSPRQGSDAQSPDQTRIDPRALADRVYRLMKRELELARERKSFSS